MSLQFQDVVDCLIVLYPEFDFVFLFVHSQGYCHARKRNAGALNALHMCSKRYGGTQPRILRDSTILSNNGFLGPHSPSLQLGNTQSLVFKPEDSGPCWYLFHQQSDLQRHDKPTTGRSKLVTQSEFTPKKFLVCPSDRFNLQFTAIVTNFSIQLSGRNLPPTATTAAHQPRS